MAGRSTAGFRPTDDSKSERLGFGSFELSTNDSYSRKKFRTAFIRAADNLEQGLANSLYKEAFFQFVLLAWSQYPQAIPPPVLDVLEDNDFLAELERVINDFSASPYNIDSKSIHPAFIELLLPVFNRERELFINSTRGVLTRELFRPIRDIMENSTSRAFPNWATLMKIENGETLCEILIKWSHRWNLDADWCRDYAVAALWEWLNDRYLQYQLNWDEGRLSLREATFAVQHDNNWTATIYLPATTGASAAMLSALMSRDFKFTWKGLGFQYRRWNPLASYRDEWEGDCEESFRVHLKKRYEGDAAAPTGAMRRFRAARKEYVRNVEQAAEQAGLVRTPRRWAYEHIAWAVRFQVQKWPLSKIEKTYSKPRKTVSDGINRVIRFINLDRRPDLPPGMPKGTRLRSKRRIVRN